MEIERKTFGRLWLKATEARFATRVSLSTVEVDWSGPCDAPVPREWHSYSRRDKRRLRARTIGRGAETFNRVVAVVPCRKCKGCLRARRTMWAARAIAEWKEAAAVGGRTWAGALTFRPEVQVWAVSWCRQKMREQGLDYDALTVDDRFRQLHGLLSKEVTRYLKRLRSNLGVPIRFMAVVEPHESGMPHYHMLVHEADALHPVRKAQLDSNWRGGFSHWRLCQSKRQCGYVAKYLGKDAAGRVRASVDYGVRKDSLQLNQNSRPPTSLPELLAPPGEGSMGTELCSANQTDEQED